MSYLPLPDGGVAYAGYVLSNAGVSDIHDGINKAIKNVTANN